MTFKLRHDDKDVAGEWLCLASGVTSFNLHAEAEETQQRGEPETRDLLCEYRPGWSRRGAIDRLDVEPGPKLLRDGKTVWTWKVKVAAPGLRSASLVFKLAPLPPAAPVPPTGTVEPAQVAQLRVVAFWPYAISLGLLAITFVCSLFWLLPLAVNLVFARSFGKSLKELKWVVALPQAGVLLGLFLDLKKRPKALSVIHVARRPEQAMTAALGCLAVFVLLPTRVFTVVENRSPLALAYQPKKEESIPLERDTFLTELGWLPPTGQALEARLDIKADPTLKGDLCLQGASYAPASQDCVLDGLEKLPSVVRPGVSRVVIDCKARYWTELEGLGTKPDDLVLATLEADKIKIKIKLADKSCAAEPEAAAVINAAPRLGPSFSGKSALKLFFGTDRDPTALAGKSSRLVVRAYTPMLPALPAAPPADERPGAIRALTLLATKNSKEASTLHLAAATNAAGPMLTLAEPDAPELSLALVLGEVQLKPASPPMSPSSILLGTLKCIPNQAVSFQGQSFVTWLLPLRGDQLGELVATAPSGDQLSSWVRDRSNPAHPAPAALCLSAAEDKAKLTGAATVNAPASLKLTIDESRADEPWAMYLPKDLTPSTVVIHAGAKKVGTATCPREAFPRATGFHVARTVLLDDGRTVTKVMMMPAGTALWSRAAQAPADLHFPWLCLPDALDADLPLKLALEGKDPPITATLHPGSTSAAIKSDTPASPTTTRANCRFRDGEFSRPLPAGAACAPIRINRSHIPKYLEERFGCSAASVVLCE